MIVEPTEVKSPSYTRTAWFHPGPSHPHALAVILDGEHYLNSIHALETLEGAIADKHIPPMSLLFLSHGGAAARHVDYICNDTFARYVAGDVLNWARERAPSITPEGNLICGVSLSGLASAHLALTYPQVFSSALCQSGSFWWNQKHFATLVPRHAPLKQRFWLSVGDKETQVGVSHPPTGMRQEFSQIDGVQSAVDALRNAGAEVTHRTYHGGHEFGPWAEELGEAVRWLR